MAAAERLDAKMEKQLTAMYDSVESLKDTSFHKLQQQLERAAYVYGWPANILDVDNDNVDPNPDAETLHHIKNAYMVITTKCDGHPVENLLEAIQIGDAVAAWRCVYRHFNKNTGRPLPASLLQQQIFTLRQ